MLQKNSLKTYNKRHQKFLTSTSNTPNQQAETCHICDKQLGENRVRDHCHILGHFRRAAHNQCNLNYRIKPNS